DVVWSYAGVRPLLDDASGDPSAVTRDYLLEANHAGGRAAPLLTVWGGKITTFRKLAEDAADEIGRMLGEPRRAWTEGAFLPGGDLSAWIGAPRRPDTDFERFVAELRRRMGWLPGPLARRLARAYGSRVDRVLGDAGSLAGLGAEVAPGLHEAELDYLRREEWSGAADDVLWRRSKLGLHYTPAERSRVSDWMARRSASAAPKDQPSHAAAAAQATQAPMPAPSRTGVA
uniref:glycerol-3-phosphate dehydrogenase C-terminal domain-containing protein n=1 Tax=Methylibium sp. TaxID=2067992 RepID=UPI0017D6B2E1